MPTPKSKSPVQKFLTNKRQYPLLAGVLAGLYPVLFYATNNFTLVNTWGHLGYFVATFLVIPIVIIYAGHFITTKVSKGKWLKYVIPFLGTFGFLFLMHISYYGSIKKKISVGLLLVACLVAYFLWKQYKKIMIVQGILAMIGFITFIPKIIEALTYDDSWKALPENLAQVTFDKTPNIYFIQPDGYVNFSELSKGYYTEEENKLKEYLVTNDFELFPDFRGNYASTLTSNSATFTGKHHYYDRGLSLETYNARNTIVSENWVLDVLKQNNYETHFITELPYLLLNRPEMGYDSCNISYDDVSYIGTGLGDVVPTFEPLKKEINTPSDQPKFFFLQIFNPGHIHGNAGNSEGRVKEKELWFESVAEANKKVEAHVALIKKSDPEALIVIMADHGGFVGMDYTSQVFTKSQDRDLLHSVFSVNLAVHWPNNEKYEGKKAKSAVNVFRMLFSYLSSNPIIMETVEDNSSFLVIKEEASPGVYKVLDENGQVTFEKQ